MDSFEIPVRSNDHWVFLVLLRNGMAFETSGIDGTGKDEDGNTWVLFRQADGHVKEEEILNAFPGAKIPFFGNLGKRGIKVRLSEIVITLDDES